MHWIFITYLFLRDIHEGILSTEDAFREQDNSFCKLKIQKRQSTRWQKIFSENVRFSLMREKKFLRVLKVIKMTGYIVQ